MGNKYTEAQSKASAKYIREKTDQIMIRVPKGEKARIEKYATEKGFGSLTEFIRQAIYEKMSIR